MSNSVGLRMATMAVAFATYCGSVHAVNNDFTCADSTWNNAGCWTNGVPNSTDTARILINNHVDYQFAGAVTLAALHLQSNTLMTLSQDVLTTNSLQINSTFGGTARLEQTGGTVNVGGNAILGVNPFSTTGEYDLSGSGQLTVSGTMSLGNQGIGNFSQSGGTANIGQILMGTVADASGSYTMSSGSLSVGLVHLGAGSGSFIQNGGSSTVTGDFIEVDASLSGGALNVQGQFDPANFTLAGTGLLTVDSAVSLSGGNSFTQTAGSASFATLNLNAASSFNLLGGDFNATNLNLNGATFSGPGGTFTYTNIDMGGGTLDLDLVVGSGQTLNANGNITGALVAQGTVTLSGDLTVGSLDNNTAMAIGTRTLVLGGASSNSDSMTLAGGSIGGPGTLTNNATMSGWGGVNGSLVNNGTFTQSGGDLTVDGDFTNSGSFAQSDGNLVIAGGFTNDGTTTLGFNRTLHLDGGDFTNNNNLTLFNNTVTGTGTFVTGAGGHTAGFGQISSAVDNAGTLEARNGDLLVFGSSLNNSGTLKNAVGSNLFVAAASVVNNGDVEVNAAGAVTFASDLTNTTGHSVVLRGGAFSAPTLTNLAGGVVSGAGTITANLINAGETDFFGTTSIFGDVTNQSGGHFLVRNDQTLIAGHTVNDGTIETLNGSVIFEGGLTNNGALLFDPSTITVPTLEVGTDGYLAETGDPGDRFIITEDFVNASTRNTDWQTTHTVFQFNGGSHDVTTAQLLEAASADLGNHIGAWDNNFALGTLEIGTSDTYVSLIDAFDNSSGSGAEALYIYDLIVHDGATFDYGDLNVYVLNGISGDGILLGTGQLSLGVVPLPPAAWLFGSAVGLFAFRVRKRRMGGGTGA